MSEMTTPQLATDLRTASTYPMADQLKRSLTAAADRLEALQAERDALAKLVSLAGVIISQCDGPLAESWLAAEAARKEQA